MLSTISRGLPFYGGLKIEFPYHWNSFKSMQRRSSLKSYECDFTYDVDGFIDFILYLGAVPFSIKIPTIGRLDHSKGYIKGNFKWEEQYDNYSEAGTRLYESETAGYKQNQFYKKCNELKIKLVQLNENKTLNDLLVYLNYKDPRRLLWSINKLLETDFNLSCKFKLIIKSHRNWTLELK